MKIMMSNKYNSQAVCVWPNDDIIQNMCCPFANIACTITIVNVF